MHSENEKVLGVFDTQVSLRRQKSRDLLKMSAARAERSLPPTEESRIEPSLI